jgi:hypothetical protein
MTGATGAGGGGGAGSSAGGGTSGQRQIGGVCGCAVSDARAGGAAALGMIAFVLCRRRRAKSS